jgi:hypothetical protein
VITGLFLSARLSCINLVKSAIKGKSLFRRRRKMAEKNDTHKTGASGKKKVLSVIFVLIPTVIFGLYLAGKLFVGTPYASKRLSEFLTGFLQQRVTIAGLSLSGTTLSVQGITVENPKGFQKGSLLRTGSLVIAPNWPGILAGKKDLSLLQVEGLQLHLSKNPGGDWNYRQLIHFLTLKKKQPAAEFHIKHLVLRDFSLQINNFAWKNLALTLNDFSTKGSTGSNLLFTGKDTKGNPFRLGGDIRLGKNPFAHLTLTAPDLSLDTFRDVTKTGSKLDLEKGIAHVNLSAGYQSGEFATTGNVRFEQLGVNLKDGRIPLAGTLDLTARYNISRDEARFERCSLTINKVLRLKAGATVRKVKGEKEFRHCHPLPEIGERPPSFVQKYCGTTFDRTITSGICDWEYRRKGHNGRQMAVTLRNGDVESGTAR